LQSRKRSNYDRLKRGRKIPKFKKTRIQRKTPAEQKRILNRIERLILYDTKNHYDEKWN